jgi:hypothetical protein
MVGQARSAYHRQPSALHSTFPTKNCCATAAFGFGNRNLVGVNGKRDEYRIERRKPVVA